MEPWGFNDGNIHDLLNRRFIHTSQDASRCLQIHSSLIRRFSQENELEGHQGCVNSISWNSSGSLLISGSDDTRINVWSYTNRSLLHSIETGHCANIFCTKFVPETSDELVVSGAGDAEVRLFNLSRLSGRGPDDNSISPHALYQCHTRRVKKLAVEVGNPNVVWSASEDGTLRQHDLREGTSCPPAGSPHQECCNVLIDLRCGAKRSLADPPRQTLALKSCDISASRPHLILVGGSDAFARLYDRRMLPPVSSSQKKMSPPRCVNYYCPMHLSDRGHSSLHLTHVAFSPNGEEVLLNYSGEHIYLMDINDAAGGGTMVYTPADVPRLTSFIPNYESVKPASSVFQNGHTNLDRCKKLIQIAKRSLEDGNYHYGIEACSEVLDGLCRNIEPTLKLDFLCTRAALLLKRKWKNDVHMAIRDCFNARSMDSSSFRANYHMSEALSQLGKHKEALEFAVSAQQLALPSNRDVIERLESVRKDLVAGEAGSDDKGNGKASRGGRLTTLTDMIYRAEANSDASPEGPGSDREESDYDDELELDFDTSLSDDDEPETDPNILSGSLNLRIHRKNENGSHGSPSSSHNETTSYQPEAVIDMKQRYVGHCNVGTDIKQASFLGQKGEYVATGSDDGRWFIWEKQTGRLIKILRGDASVVNCVQSHPFDCAVATSGIDNTIKIWSPTAPVASTVVAGSAGPESDDFLLAMEGNQNRLSSDREAILGFEILERFRVHEFAEGNMHPFECAQS